MSTGTCASSIARRYGSAACDQPSGHAGLHEQSSTGITWTDARALASWLEDDA